ncbi:hypothetical protein DRQ26_05930 [bacterium]|nr:MAG: hypothetical protein DRQ26_05930 [bacterium]
MGEFLFSEDSFMDIKIIENITFDVSLRRILIRMGYSAREEIPEEEYAFVEQNLAEMLALCVPKIATAELNVEKVADGKIFLEENISFRSTSLLKTLGNSVRVMIYAATIGSAVERMSARFSEDGKYKLSLLWDSFGSEAAEVLAQKISLMAHQRAKMKRMRITSRYSPGYGDLDVMGNRKIIELLDADKIGMKCEDSGMLLPRKSTTGIIGYRRID